jgi:hypothetical protein
LYIEPPKRFATVLLDTCCHRRSCDLLFGKPTILLAVEANLCAVVGSTAATTLDSQSLIRNPVDEIISESLSVKG